MHTSLKDGGVRIFAGAFATLCLRKNLRTLEFIYKFVKEIYTPEIQDKNHQNIVLKIKCK